MRLTAHQPSYVPWLGLLAKIASADQFCIFDGVPMEGSGFENRQRIKTASGVQWLTVPVRRHMDTRICDVEIATDQPWARKHWRTIELAYQKAPFFGQYADELKSVLFGLPGTKWSRLADLDEVMLRHIMDQFGIETPIVRASDYNFQGAKSDLVLDMCKQLGATEYIFGSQGRDYADVPSFEAAGIKVSFQDYKHPEYPQLHGPFVSHMGAIDLLFNVGGAQGRKIIMGER
jgi:hypothetical protein